MSISSVAGLVASTRARAVADRRTAKRLDPSWARAEALTDARDVIRISDLVLGGVSVAAALAATVAAFAGGATVRTAILVWSFPALNLVWTRLAQRSRHLPELEVLRCAANMPLIVSLCLVKGGYFEAFWLPALVIVVGQSVMWGCLTARALAGHLVTAAYGAVVLSVGILSGPGARWSPVRAAFVIIVTGFMLSVVSGRLGRSLRDARRRRDDAEQARLALKSAFDELASIRNQLDAVLECAPGFIVAVNRDFDVEFLNRAVAVPERHSAIGQNVLDLVAPEGRSEFERSLRFVLDTGNQVDVEVRQANAGSNEGWLAAHIGVMRRAQEVVGAVVVAQDVTQLRRTRAEVIDAQRMAAVGTLASGIAHEINTPIQFVNDSTHFLRDAARDLFAVIDALQAVKDVAARESASASLTAALARAAEAAEQADLPYLVENVPLALETCLDGLNRVTTIVRAMKEFAHPPQKDMAAVDLNQAIQSTLTIARNEYKYVADIETDFGELPPISCHVNEINQVVLNLLVNAAHAVADVVKNGTSRGVIRVATRREADEVVIVVSDTGAGIPEAVRARVFEPFFTTKEVGRGTGQGLALAWSVVKEKHGGDIRFETEVGVGTTFTVRLPIAGRGRPSVLRHAGHAAQRLGDAE
jgi:PAS domain S-box-containing protein